jgi:hypothetical protein
MDALSKELCPKWEQFQKDYSPESAPKRYNIEKCSRRTFEKLANDNRVEGGRYTRTSVDEARAINQAKKQGLVIKSIRTEHKIAKQVDLDFQVEGTNNYTDFDMKNQVGQHILDAPGQNKTIFQMATEIGEKITKQKTTFVGIDNGPLSPKNLGYIIDLCYVIDPAEKIIVRDQIQNAAGNLTSMDIFL